MSTIQISPAPRGFEKWRVRLRYNNWFCQIADRMRYLVGVPPKMMTSYVLDTSGANATVTFTGPPPAGAIITIEREYVDAKELMFKVGVDGL